MTIFRVGMRVRIVRPNPMSPERMKYIGRECAITETNVTGLSIGSQLPYIGHRLDFKNEFDRWVIACPSQLEPITDRPALAEWSDCAWSPHRVGVGL